MSASKTFRALAALLAIGLSGACASRTAPPTAGEAPTSEVTLRIQLAERAAGFATQGLEAGSIVRVRVTVLGAKNSTLVSGSADCSNGAVTPVTLRVPQGDNLVFKVTADGFASVGPVSAGTLYALASVPQDTAITLSERTTPAGRIISQMRTNQSALAETLDRNALQELVEKLIDGRDPLGPTATMSPFLLDTTALANRIGADGKLPNTFAPFTMKTGTLIGNISGLLLGQTAQVSADDYTSRPVQTDAAGHFVINGVAPGVPYNLTVTSPYYAPVRFSETAMLAGESRTVGLTLAGNYLKNAFSSWGGAVGSVRRFSQLPIRLLVIVPTGSHIGAAGYSSTARSALSDAIATLRASFPSGVIDIEETEIKDSVSDQALSDAIRRSDIYVRWVRRTRDAGGDSNPEALGSTFEYPGTRNVLSFPQEVSKFKTYQARITLATQHNDGTKLYQTTLRAAALHELLHALGVCGHSDNPADLMYGTLQDPPVNGQLNANDIRTLRFLYALPANEMRDHLNYSSVPTTQNDATISYSYMPN